MKKFFLFAAAALFAANVMAQPTTAPAAPAHAAADVHSLFSVYGNNMSPMGWGGGWEKLTIDGTDILYFAAGTWDCIGLDSIAKDCTGFEYLHVDAWSNGDNTVAFTLESTGNVEPKTKYDGNQLRANQWVSFDLEMATCYPGVTGQSIAYFIYEAFSGEGTANNQLAIANIYFHHGAVSGVENVAAEKAQKMIENGQIVILKNGVRYNVLGAKL